MKLRVFLIGGLAPVFSTHAYAQPAPEQIVVIGTMADSSIGLAADKMAGTLQSLSADSLSAGHGATVLTGLSSQAAGVSLSDLQGYSMFQDLRIHGIEASPLQGVAQGLVLGADLVFTAASISTATMPTRTSSCPPSPPSACMVHTNWAAAGRLSAWWTICSTATPPAMAPISIPVTLPGSTPRR